MTNFHLEKTLLNIVTISEREEVEEHSKRPSESYVQRQTR